MGEIDHQLSSSKPPRRRAGRIFLVIAAACLLAVAGTVGVLYALNTPPRESSGRQLEFSVRKGESVLSIALRLQREGVIRSARVLSVLSVLRGTQDRFQSGNYLIPGGLSTVEIHDFFLCGRQQLVRVTIPEGWTIRRVAAHLEAAGLVAAELFVAASGNQNLLDGYGIPAPTAEGYLYPDTYQFHEGLSAETILGHMIDRFFRVLHTLGPGAVDLSAAQLHDAVVLASIIEREYMVADEADVIASVFYNRLDVGMPLESCATVVYVMTEELGLPHPNRLFFRDLERPSAFNTYRNAGLPPAPIANPGRIALDAALHPARSDYRFFVLRGPNAQRHHFSRNYQEHNEATVFYLRTAR